MKITIYFILFILLAGCTGKKPDVEKMENLKDVSYNVDGAGEVLLTKTYEYDDGNSSKKSEVVSKSNDENLLKGYEAIPSFNKNDIENVTLKQNKDRKKAKILVKKGSVKVSVESIPVNEFVDLIFGNVLQLNYTVAKEVESIKNPVTLNMSESQSKQEVFDTISKILSLEGIDIKKENGTFFISAGKQAAEIKKDIFIGYGRKVDSHIPDDKEIIQLFPYSYIAPRKAIEFINFSGIDTGHVSYSFPSGHIGMLKGKAGDIKKAINVIELVDRPYLEGKVSFLVEFKNIEVDDFKERMKGIYDVNGIPLANVPNELGIVMSAIPELNSLLVISPKQEWVDMLMFWKNKLDRQSEMSPDPKFYTYKVQNRKADELAEALNSVINIKLAALGSKKPEIEVSGEIKSSKANVKNIGKPAGASNYSIKADLSTNMLMMQLLPAEYREVLPLIETLDVLPLQVLIEVTLAEVTLTDTFSLGFEYALQNNAALGSSVSTLPGDAITAAFGGRGFGATYASKNLDIVMNAYAEDKLLSILSKPKILILNNETGSMNVGTQIPVVSSETSANDISGATPSILRNIEYRNTGVQVGLTPTINSNGVLTLNINLVLSEAQLNDTSTIDSPLIVNRALSTALILKNGETVLLGGLIAKNKSSTESGVPLLRDIPWLGSLFQAQSEKITKTELIMLIKPNIIQKPDELGIKTKKYRLLLELLDQYSLL